MTSVTIKPAGYKREWGFVNSITSAHKTHTQRFDETTSGSFLKIIKKIFNVSNVNCSVT